VDGLGSVRQWTDAQGRVTYAADYAPYGEQRGQQGGTASRWGFTGEWWDSYIKLIQMGARWYDPDLGRWISPVTIIPDPANPQSLNRYMYVLGNVLKYVDPSGHAECVDAECNWVVHPVSGRVIQRTRTRTDPVFGGEDFLSSHPIAPANPTASVYRINGAPTAQALANAAQEYNVPPEIIAAILQYENNPEYGLPGVVRRAFKITFTPLLQAVDPQHDSDSGYSLGLANIKPGTAEYIALYFAQNYPGSSVEDYAGYSELVDPDRSVQFVAAYARMAIDALYWPGYDGPMSLDGLTLVIAHHHTGAAYPVSWGNYDFGPALLVSASEGNAILYFYLVAEKRMGK